MDIKLFEEKKVRTHFDADKEKWYFSIVDVVSLLTNQPHHQGARNYWKVLKSRLLKEGNETVTNCNRLKMVAEDGKLRETDVAQIQAWARHSSNSYYYGRTWDESLPRGLQVTTPAKAKNEEAFFI